MADRRANDLSYGHLGKAAYDPEEHQWSFSVDTSQDETVQQLEPLQECLPPSMQALPPEQDRKEEARLLKSQIKGLFKLRPETFAANNTISTLMSQGLTQASASPGSLFSTGRAVDSARSSGSRAPQIFAIVSGEAGNALKIIKLRSEKFGWDKQSGTKVSLSSVEASEQGYWMGTGGPIRQIVFSEEKGTLGTWLAVRQATNITIFRPMYGESKGSESAFSDPPNTFVPMTLIPNPVAALNLGVAGLSDFVDFAFNPWYPRQIAVIDPVGSWSIWEIEGRHGQKTHQKIIHVKSGKIYDDYISVSTSKLPARDNSDAWHRILWAGDLSTIILCGRHYMAVFCLSEGSSRLVNDEFMATNGTDRILDIIRSSINPTNLYILTSSRIFWVEIFPSGSEGYENRGLVKVLLSYRHFRDAKDDTLKLHDLRDDILSVFICSSHSRFINFYCFRVGDVSGIPTSYHGSFTLSADCSNKVGVQNAVCAILPANLHFGTSHENGGGRRYDDLGVRFFQIWILSSQCGLYSALCAAWNRSNMPIGFVVTAPTNRISRFLPSGRRVRVDSFIVPDQHGDFGDSIGSREREKKLSKMPEAGSDRHLRINWEGVFKAVFLRRNMTSGLPAADSLSNTYDRIKRGIEEDNLGLLTLLELSESSHLSGDLDQVAIKLKGFLSSLQVELNPESRPALILSNVSNGVSLTTIKDGAPLDLMTVYDNLVDDWMACLPLNVSNTARLSKFRIVRQMTIEIGFSAYAVSAERRSLGAPTTTHEQDTADDPNLQAGTRESSPAGIFSSQLLAVPDRENDFGLPTPSVTNRTPSLYSHATSASELHEDPAISRLRQYAVSIKSRPNFNHSKILSQWPSSSGADPATYSYEDAQKATLTEGSGDEGYRVSRREEARRRRRTEQFLKRERARVAESSASKPPSFGPSGSQPLAYIHPGFSSQNLDDLPMTQPDKGTFGSRIKQNEKKKPKRRTAGFR